MPASVPSEIVESYLLGITADPLSRQAVFQFRTPDGQRNFTMTAHDVDELSVNEFLKQNTVHQVHILDDGSNREELKDLLADLLFTKADASEVTDVVQLAELEKRIDSVLKGEQILVEVEPVYGASALVLAGSVSWDR